MQGDPSKLGLNKAVGGTGSDLTGLKAPFRSAEVYIVRHLAPPIRITI
jgi:hypothetical protein